MKKGKLLNSDISRVISKLGHTDHITIGDSGLPIDSSVERVDLALTYNIPGFIDTLEIILTEQYVEKVVLASEIKTKNKKMLEAIVKILEKYEEKQNNKIEIEFVSHENFKDITKESKAVVRTGEITPYSNIILYSGVVF